MRSSLALPWVQVGLVLLLACGPTQESGGNAAGNASVSANAADPVADSFQEATCWLRNATPEEAAERPSPLGETEIPLGGQIGKICYSRPVARGRVVEGGLIPFGAPWRLGANEATAIHLPFRAKVGEIDLGPGRYSLFAIPGETQWEFVLNSNAERWGIPIDEGVRSSDIGSFVVYPETMPEPVEQLTIRWRPGPEGNGHLVLEWGTTRVEIEVSLSGETP